MFGMSPHRNYDNLKRLEEEKGESFNVIVPDCYETNDVLLNLVGMYIFFIIWLMMTKFLNGISV